MKKIIISVIIFYFGVECIYGQAGKLDPTFGTNGIVKTNIGNTGNYYTTGSAVVTQPDGSMYLVVRAGSWMEIIKKFADGSTDTRYGDNGSSVPVLLPGAGYVYNVVAPKVALQAEGKLVVADLFSESFSVARFNTDGTLDKTFGTNGIAITGDGQKDVATSIAIAANGNIIVAGYSYSDYNYDFILSPILLFCNLISMVYWKMKTFQLSGDILLWPSKVMEKLLLQDF
ncbi:MAG: delta-60 repeat domain-containing protein [Mucilaginibacter sp.]